MFCDRIENRLKGSPQEKLVQVGAVTVCAALRSSLVDFAAHLSPFSLDPWLINLCALAAANPYERTQKRTTACHCKSSTIKRWMNL